MKKVFAISDAGCYIFRKARWSEHKQGTRDANGRIYSFQQGPAKRERQEANMIERTYRTDRTNRTNMANRTNTTGNAGRERQDLNTNQQKHADNTFPNFELKLI